jgi:hypothetical protein
MPFTNATDPFLLITPEEEELLKPGTHEELDQLMDELEKHKYPRVQVCIPSLVFQETAVTQSKPSSNPPKPVRTPSVEVHINSQILTPTKKPQTNQTPPSKVQSPPSGKKGIPIPKTWQTASSEDLLLFQLKENGGTWTDIAGEWNQISGLEYAASTLANRWRKILTRLGEPPEMVWDLDSSMFVSVSLSVSAVDLGIYFLLTW